MSRSHSHRASRRRRAAFPMGVETLEGRTLLSLSPVADINKVPAFPADITAVNGKIFSITRAPDGGTNLVVTTAAGTQVLKDFNSPAPYASGYQVSQLTAAGSRLFFVANGGAGEELWTSDGTAAGTRMVKDINPGTQGSNPSRLTAVGSKVFFTAGAPGAVPTGGSLTLFESDGTAAGTVPVPAVPGSPAGTTLGANALAAYHGELYFLSGTKLLKADGTANGTAVVQQFATPAGGPFGAYSFRLAATAGALYIAADDNSGTTALWESDGTAAGTTLLKSFPAPGSSGSSPYLGPGLDNMTAVGTRLFFTANDAANGPALWVSDGTASGTTLVKAFSAQAASYYSTNFSPIGNPTAVGSRLFFTTADGNGPTGIHLWVSDGTGPGTLKLADISPAVQNSSPTIVPGQFAALNGSLYFANYGPVKGLELWKSDGTPAGTGFFKDINPGPQGSAPGHMAAIGGTLYFSASDGTPGNQLWKTNGTPAGTVKVQTFLQTATASALTDGFGGGTSFATIGGLMLFAANDGIHGEELWRTDGSTSGTVMLRDLTPGPLSSNPSHLASAGGKVYFTKAGAGGVTLWASNGTAAGTTSLGSFPGSVPAFVPYNGGVVFFDYTSANGSSGVALWKSDGTAAGTTMVKQFTSPSTYGAEASDITVFNGKLYFSATNGSTATSPWVSDGTPGGTAPLAPGANITNAGDFAVFKNKLVFAAADGSSGPALWTSDGTAAGTAVLADLGSTASQPTALTVAGPNLYFFTTVSGQSGATVELWKSDGTAAGTGRVPVDFSKDYIPAPTPVGLPNGSIVFEVGTPGTSNTPMLFQPWVSNGTAAGTMLLKNIQCDFVYSPARVIGGTLYFSGKDAATGQELWRTDGTAAGTALVQDVHRGGFSSFPSPLTLLNGNLIVVADDGVHGFELLTNGNPATSRPPTILPVPNTSVSVGSTLTLTVKAIDSTPWKVLTYSLAPGAPAGMTINAKTGVITWKPAKAMTVKVTVRVADNSSPALISTTAFTVTALKVMLP